MAVGVALVFAHCDELCYPRAQLRFWRVVSPNDGFAIRVFPDQPFGGRIGNPLRARNCAREARGALAVFRVRDLYKICAKWIVHCVRMAAELPHIAIYTIDGVK